MAKKKLTEFFSRVSIRSTIYLYFTISALTALILMGISFYGRLVGQMTAAIQEENQTMLAQVNHSVDSYLRTIMKLSDSLYYDVIKNADLSTESIHNELNLLYDNNRDCVSNIALFSRQGELIDTFPAARLKTGLDVTAEDWFTDTLERTENLHFTTPHVQYIFDSDENQYTWVITMTRAVEITKGVSAEQGILLIDITYGSLKQLLDSITMGNHGYLYLVSPGGQLIYHPQMQLIDAGQMQENFRAAAGYRDGNCRESYQGEIRDVTVKSVGYTGWKLVGVVPAEQVLDNYGQILLFFFFIVLFSIFLLVFVNLRLSEWITAPMKKLDRAVRELEAGQEGVDFSVNGPHELEHLSRSIQSMVSTLRHLMDDILEQEEQKRRSELDVLQSQINPHFLYNTLDSVVWMTENGRTEDAVVMLTALARFFRISLSRGSNIIPIADELEHARHYLTIQKMRYKNKFSADITAESGVESLYTIKLIIQPILENAIYHGMAYADGDGEIHIRAFRDGEDVIIEVADNGPGMPEDLVEQLLSPHGPAVSGAKGSGIGFRNVHQRIQLTFGPTYGLTILSEPDSGTTVRIRIPALDESAAAAYRKEGPV